MRAAYLIAIGALSGGCGHHQAPDAPEVEPAWSYDLSLLAAFSTQAPAGGELTAALEPASAWTEEIDGQLRVLPTRQFRDGSQGWWVEIEDFTVLERRGEESSGPSPHPLKGLGVEIRRFGDGEVLAIDQAEYLLGKARGGEAYDVIFPLLSPAPPDLEEGASGMRSARWPFEASRQLGWENRQSLLWTNHGLELNEGTMSWRLSYEGEWTTKGGSQEPGRELRVEGGGPVRGTVWLRRGDHRLMAHSFQWERDLRVSFHTDGRASVHQSQTYHGLMRLRR